MWYPLFYFLTQTHMRTHNKHWLYGIIICSIGWFRMSAFYNIKVELSSRSLRLWSLILTMKATKAVVLIITLCWEKSPCVSCVLHVSPRAMPEDTYTVRVSVDGVPIAENNTCKGLASSRACSFSVRGIVSSSWLSLCLSHKTEFFFLVFIDCFPFPY